jgi:hypothetical protein
MINYIRKNLREDLLYWGVDDASAESDEYTLGANDVSESEDDINIPTQEPPSHS